MMRKAHDPSPTSPGAARFAAGRWRVCRGGPLRPRTLLAILAGVVGLPLLMVGCGQLNLTEMRREAVEEDLAAIKTETPQPSGPLSLKECIDLACNYNLEAAVKRLDQEIQAETISGAKLEMLPDLSIEQDWSERDTLRVSSSKSIITGEVSEFNTFSSPRDSLTANIALAWSVLDFGLAYFKSRQESRRIDIMRQDLRRTRQKLSLDVAKAYWKAVVAKTAADKAEGIVAKAEERQAKIERQIEDGALKPIEGLKNKKKVLMLQIRLKGFRRQFEQSMIELGSLMGLRPGAGFSLADPAMLEVLPEDTRPVEKLENTALMNRPELFSQDLEGVIQADEVKIQILRLFPNTEFTYDNDHDNNPFLKYDHWFTVGVNTTFHLLSIPRQWTKIRGEKKKQAMMKKRRLMLAMGVMVQVHLARLEQREARTQCELAQSLADLQGNLLNSARKRVDAGELDEGSLLDIEAETLFAKVRYSDAYAEYMIARARMENTLGFDNCALAASGESTCDGGGCGTPLPHMTAITDADTEAATLQAMGETPSLLSPERLDEARDGGLFEEVAATPAPVTPGEGWGEPIDRVGVDPWQDDAAYRVAETAPTAPAATARTESLAEAVGIVATDLEPLPAAEPVASDATPEEEIASETPSLIDEAEYPSTEAGYQGRAIADPAAAMGMERWDRSTLAEFMMLHEGVDTAPVKNRPAAFRTDRAVKTPVEDGPSRFESMIPEAASPAASEQSRAPATEEEVSPLSQGVGKALDYVDLLPAWVGGKSRKPAGGLADATLATGPAALDALDADLATMAPDALGATRSNEVRLDPSDLDAEDWEAGDSRSKALDLGEMDWIEAAPGAAASGASAEDAFRANEGLPLPSADMAGAVSDPEPMPTPTTRE